MDVMEREPGRRSSSVPVWPALAGSRRQGVSGRIRLLMTTVTVMVVALVAGCTGGDADPAPTVTATPSPTARRLEPGTQVELTAAVTRLLGPNAFLVADADLPVTGQVVVSEAPVTVQVTDLVTVTGLVEVLDRAALGRYGVSDPQVYETSGGVVVVAASVDGYLPASPQSGGAGSPSSPR